MAYYRLKAAGWLRNIGYHPRSLVVFSCQSYVPHLVPLTSANLSSGIGPFLIRMDRLSRSNPLDRTDYLFRSFRCRNGVCVLERLQLLGGFVFALRRKVSFASSS